MTAPFTVRVRAPAKINLYLSVGDLREDGYHDADDRVPRR